MAAVFEGRVHWFGWLERPIYRALGTSPSTSRAGNDTRGPDRVLRGFAPHHLPDHCGSRLASLNPSTSGPLHCLVMEYSSFLHHEHELAELCGETTMSYFTQMAALTFSSS